MARHLITVALNLLNVNGLNPLNHGIRIKVIAILSFLTYALYATEMLMAVVARWKGMESMDDVSGLIGVYQILVKFSVIIQNRKRLAAVLCHINQCFWKLDKYGEKFQAEALHEYNVIKIAMVISATFSLSTGVAYYLKPLFSSTRSLPVDMYHPANISNGFTYALAYMFQVFVLVTISVPALFGFDCLFIALLVHIIQEMKMVNIGFTRISTDNERKGDETKALDELKGLIDHHVLVLSCIKHMRKSYSMVLLSQFLDSLFLMGFCLLAIIAEGFPPAPSQLIRPVPYMLSYVATLFIYCYGGTVLTMESQSVADAAYESSWWVKTQPELRRRVALAIQRAQKVEKLTAGEMFDLNLASFANVMRSTFSFFTLAQAILTKSQGK